MDQSDSYVPGADSASAIEKNTMLWGIFLVGLVVGFVGVYLVAAQPMFAQIDRLQRQVVAVQNDMESLVGVRDQAWETSNLLSGLTAQQRQLADARATIKEIRQLRQDLQVEAGQMAQSFQALADLKKLKTTVLDQRDLTAPATKAVEDIALVQKRLIAEHGAFPKAEATLADLDRTKTGLDELLRLKNQLLEQGVDTAAAQAKATEFVALKDTIVAQTNTNDAKKSAEDLIALKDQVAGQAGSTDAAVARVAKLFSMQNQLENQGADMTIAFSTLDNMGALKAKLVSQTQEVAEAMQNLEILSDFQDEFAEQIRTLGKMRQNLMEIVMLESTIGRVSRIIEPLVQIGNVRRLSEPELRDAARVILENRNTRITTNVDNQQHPEVKSEKVPDPMPLPID